MLYAQGSSLATAEVVAHYAAGRQTPPAQFEAVSSKQRSGAGGPDSSTDALDRAQASAMSASTVDRCPGSGAPQSGL